MSEKTETAQPANTSTTPAPEAGAVSTSAAVQVEIPGAAKTDVGATRDYAAELAVAEKRAAKLEKESKALASKFAEVDGVLSKLKGALGVDAQPAADPLAEANAIRARADKAAQTAAAALFRVHAQEALLNAGIRKDRVGAALRHVDASGIEIDIDAGSMKDAAPLAEKVNALKASLPEWFVEPKAPTGPVTAPPGVAQPAPQKPAQRVDGHAAHTMDLGELRKLLRLGGGAA